MQIFPLLAATTLAVAVTASAAPPAGDTVRLAARFNYQVTGVTIAPDGRRFVSFPRWSDDAPISVAELLPDGTTRPYPDLRWNSWRRDVTEKPDSAASFVCVQSVVADARGNLWVLDPGAPGMKAIVPGAAKLVRIDLATDRVAKAIPLSGAIVAGSYLNDVRISPDGGRAYLTDSGKRGAIVVVNLRTGAAWRTIDGLPSTQTDPAVTARDKGRVLKTPDGKPMAGNADGIALSRDGKTLYRQALTGRTLYAIDTGLLERDVAESARTAAIRRVATTDAADGLLMGPSGTIYVTSPNDHSIKRVVCTGTQTVASDPRLSWPDTMAQGSDGEFYLTDSHIPYGQPFKANAPLAVPTELYAIAVEKRKTF